jgi:hypothetical protein
MKSLERHYQDAHFRNFHYRIHWKWKYYWSSSQQQNKIRFCNSKLNEKCLGAINNLKFIHSDRCEGQSLCPLSTENSFRRGGAEWGGLKNVSQKCGFCGGALTMKVWIFQSHFAIREWLPRRVYVCVIRSDRGHWIHTKCNQQPAAPSTLTNVDFRSSLLPWGVTLK